MQVQITKWGNSLGIRVPKEVARRMGLTEGSRVDVTTEGNRIVVTANQPIYTLDELLVGMTPQAMHEAFDWGPDMGDEAVE